MLSQSRSWLSLLEWVWPNLEPCDQERNCVKKVPVFSVAWAHPVILMREGSIDHIRILRSLTPLYLDWNFCSSSQIIIESYEQWKNPGCLGRIEDGTTQLYGNHYKPTSIMESNKGFFVAHIKSPFGETSWFLPSSNHLRSNLSIDSLPLSESYELIFRTSNGWDVLDLPPSHHPGFQLPPRLLHFLGIGNPNLEPLFATIESWIWKLVPNINSS